MWKLSASISGDLLVPSWEGSSALQWSFQHKHAEGCCVPSSTWERKPWSRVLGQQWWPIDCGTGTEPTFQPFIAQAHKISGERVVWYGTCFFFSSFAWQPQSILCSWGNPLSFQCLSVLSVAAISWSLESGRSEIVPQRSGPAFSGCLFLRCLISPPFAGTYTYVYISNQDSRAGMDLPSCMDVPRNCHPCCTYFTGATLG